MFPPNIIIALTLSYHLQEVGFQKLGVVFFPPSPEFLTSQPSRHNLKRCVANIPTLCFSKNLWSTQ